MKEPWIPRTVEDRLLKAYLEKTGGTLFLEVRVGGSANPLASRRIDGVLIPELETRAYPSGSYDSQQVSEAVEDRTVHLIEATRSLNRGVIGQVVAGSSLFARDFKPARIHPVALCGLGESDLEWACAENGVEAVVLPLELAEPSEDPSSASTPGAARVDHRGETNQAKRTAFLAGWTDAVKGQLYRTNREKKTHANMGNLFGWIYGDQDLDFRIETWDRYADSLDDSVVD